MSKFNISACNQCGHRYPTVLIEGSTRCRRCRSGTYVEIDDPTLDDILAVAKYNETVNTQPMQEWERPPQMSTWQGKELSQLTKEELIKACETLGSENRQLRDRARQDDMTALTRHLPEANTRPYQVIGVRITEKTRDITEFLNTLFLRHPTLNQLISVSPISERKYTLSEGWTREYIITFSHRHKPITLKQILEALKP